MPNFLHHIITATDERPRTRRTKTIESILSTLGDFNNVAPLDGASPLEVWGCSKNFSPETDKLSGTSVYIQTQNESPTPLLRRLAARYKGVIFTHTWVDSLGGHGRYDLLQPVSGGELQIRHQLRPNRQMRLTYDLLHLALASRTSPVPWDALSSAITEALESGNNAEVAAATLWDSDFSVDELRRARSNLQAMLGNICGMTAFGPVYVLPLWVRYSGSRPHYLDCALDTETSMHLRDLLCPKDSGAILPHYYPAHQLDDLQWSDQLHLARQLVGRSGAYRLPAGRLNYPLRDSRYEEYMNLVFTSAAMPEVQAPRMQEAIAGYLTRLEYRQGPFLLRSYLDVDISPPCNLFEYVGKKSRARDLRVVRLNVGPSVADFDEPPESTGVPF